MLTVLYHLNYVNCLLILKSIDEFLYQNVYLTETGLKGVEVGGKGMY